jgi:hypothetical protein
VRTRDSSLTQLWLVREDSTCRVGIENPYIHLDIGSRTHGSDPHMSAFLACAAPAELDLQLGVIGMAGLLAETRFREPRWFDHCPDAVWESQS